MPQADYTGNGLAPKKRALVVALLKAGEGVSETARRAKVSRNVAQAIRDQEYSDIQQSKQLMALECELAAREALDRMRAQLNNPKSKLSAVQLVPVFGVLTDKMLALRGDTPQLPPQLHAHHHVHEFIQRNLKSVTEAQVIEALPDEPARAKE